MLQALYDLSTNHDDKGVLALLTDTVVISNNYMPADIKRPEFAKSLKEDSRSFPDPSWDARKCWTAKDIVACDITWTATFKGPMKAMTGIKPTHKKARGHALDVVHFKNGEIDRIRGYPSGIEVAVAFGLMPERPPGAKPATSRPIPPTNQPSPTRRSDLAASPAGRPAPRRRQRRARSAPTLPLALRRKLRSTAGAWI